ncbi:MAG TPA: hypothetical protein DEB40_04505, partial [Elusimicrobia bacterium]|nr:hypothetical protein [Elusimicrobiota bacterium]HBT60985.1 hypothetical protein [Elusimicrobiota bacterium]
MDNANQRRPPMSPILSSLLIFSLLRPLCAAEFNYASFESIRDAQNHGQVPVVGKVVPVQYRMVPGPAAEDPDEPPNLKKEQVVSLLDQMIVMLEKNPSLPEPTEDQLQRLIRGLVLIDTKFVDPISTQRWDEIIQSMTDIARREYVPGQNWDTIIDHMLQKAVHALKEPHSAYLDPEQAKDFTEDSSGKFSGIGVEGDTHPLGMRLEFVYPDSSARRAGLRGNDVISWVDGRDVKGLRVDKIVELLRGPAGAGVRIKVIRNGRLMGPVKIMREEIEIPNAFKKMASPTIGYIYFSEFREETDKQVFKLIGELRAQGARGIVLDVRGNPGGYVPTVASITSEFLRDGDEIVSFKHQGQVAEKAVTQGDGKFADVPVVVLVDGDSASASEILSGALQDKRRRYTVIGSRSYGKGTQQVIMDQGDGRMIKITENRWHTPNDRNIDARHDPKTGEEIPGTGGIVPDIIVPVPSEQAAKIAKDIRLELFGRPIPRPRTPD